MYELKICALILYSWCYPKNIRTHLIKLLPIVSFISAVTHTASSADDSRKIAYELSIAIEYIEIEALRRSDMTELASPPTGFSFYELLRTTVFPGGELKPQRQSHLVNTKLYLSRWSCFFPSVPSLAFVCFVRGLESLDAYNCFCSLFIYTPFIRHGTMCMVTINLI